MGEHWTVVTQSIIVIPIDLKLRRGVERERRQVCFAPGSIAIYISISASTCTCVCACIAMCEENGSGMC